MLGPPSVAKPTDSTPHLPAAGQHGEPNAVTAEQTLKPEFFDQAPPTPPHIKKWRKETAPGKICLHPGVAEDSDYARLDTYGKSEPVGVKVHEVLNTAPKSYLMEKAVEKRESIYLSNKREPLGKAMSRGHNLPAEMQFGRPTPQDVAGDQSKALLHPEERLIPEHEHQLYVRSHKNYDPGEQRRRGYTWKDQDGNIDPTTHRFGAAVKHGMHNGVGKAMNPELDENYKRPAVVVDKQLEDFRAVNAERLGVVQNLGFGNAKAGANDVCGMPSQSGPEWGVKQCIGNYTPEDQKPDTDLGRSIRPGWRNIGNEKRTFGVPSIRTDIPAPGLKSVADHQNYGDEAGADTILYPPRFADEGVTQADFLVAQQLDELVDIFRTAGFELNDEEARDAHERAAKRDPQGLVSVQSFRMALNGDF